MEQEIKIEVLKEEDSQECHAQKAEKGSRKRKRARCEEEADKDRTNISCYTKTKILDHFKQHGASSADFDEALKMKRLPKECIAEYFNNHIIKAQKNLPEECDSLCFENTNGWLELLKEWSVPAQCSYEPAFMLHAIADNEQQPDANEMNGIDLRLIYKSLANNMLGIPGPVLNMESAAFLTREFEMMIEEANTNQGTYESKCLADSLADKNKPLRATRQCTQSLDPLLLNKEMI